MIFNLLNDSIIKRKRTKEAQTSENNTNETPDCCICGRSITYRHYERRLKPQYICDRGCWDVFRLFRPYPIRTRSDGIIEIWMPKLVWIPRPNEIYADDLSYKPLGDWRESSYHGGWVPSEWYIIEGWDFKDSNAFKGATV